VPWTHNIYIYIYICHRLTRTTQYTPASALHSISQNDHSNHRLWFIYDTDHWPSFTRAASYKIFFPKLFRVFIHSISVWFYSTIIIQYLPNYATTDSHWPVTDNEVVCWSTRDIDTRNFIPIILYLYEQ